MYQDDISFAGAGRVATALCRELFRAGKRIDLIVSETGTSGRSLAEECQAEWSPELSFPDSTRIVIVAVPDHRLKEALHDIKCSPETLVVHTAGSFGLDIFPDYIRRKGVFYPLQTFSKNRKINFAGLPFLLESADAGSDDILKNLAESLGGKIFFFDSEKRRKIHLAAVFVCNFTNHMLTLGKEISENYDFPFEIFNPLIMETVSKALESGPENSQTGPAVRNDRNTIEKHLELLSFSPELQKVYEELTLSIIQYYNSKK